MDNINSITVVLEQNIKEEGINQILIAIKTLKGVLTADPNIAHATSYIAYETARQDILSKIKTIFNKD